MNSAKIKVLVCDDSLLLRAILTDLLKADSRFEVVGSAHDGKAAVEKMKQLAPDVITMDVEMPVMDGVEAVKQIMAIKPTPIVMVSSITYEGGHRTMQALSAGAFDFIQKPMAQSASALANVGEKIKQKLLDAYKNRTNLTRKINFTNTVSKFSALAKLPEKLLKIKNNKNFIIGIGISTGGPPCVQEIFKSMPENSPPIVVVQHMPEGFTKAMADRINSVSKMTVQEAKTGMLLTRGNGYIAPGGQQMKILKEGTDLRLRVSADEPMTGHRPSVDYLFKSILETCGDNCVAVIMTGMGKDGVQYLKELKNKGAHTIAQDEESSVVFGMPKVAIQEQAVQEVLSLEQIIQRLKQLA